MELTAEKLSHKIAQAHRILSENCERAGKLEKKLAKLRLRTVKTHGAQMRLIAKKTWLKTEAERLRERGNKVWMYATAYQGKYINWHSVVNDKHGNTYSTHSIVCAHGKLSSVNPQTPAHT